MWKQRMLEGLDSGGEGVDDHNFEGNSDLYDLEAAHLVQSAVA